MRYFAKMTKGSVVLMGRRTWDSLPDKSRPLPDRYNIVLTSKPDRIPEVAHVSAMDDFQQAVAWAQIYARKIHASRIFVIGGAVVYAQAIKIADELVLSHVDTETVGADAFFPDFSMDEWSPGDIDTYDRSEDDEYGFTTVVYQRIRGSATQQTSR